MTTHAELLEAAAHFRGWGYGGYSASRRTADCVGLTAGCVALLRGVDPDLEETHHTPWWQALAIGDHDRPWSPIELIAEDQVAAVGASWAPGPVALPAGGVVLGQLWSGLVGGRVVLGESKGHGFWLLCSQADPRFGWVLESSSAPMGPRLVTGEGRIPLADAIDCKGQPTREWSPVALSSRWSTHEEFAWAEVR